MAWRCEAVQQHPPRQKPNAVPLHMHAQVIQLLHHTLSPFLPRPAKLPQGVLKPSITVIDVIAQEMDLVSRYVRAQFDSGYQGQLRIAPGHLEGLGQALRGSRGPRWRSPAAPERPPAPPTAWRETPVRGGGVQVQVDQGCHYTSTRRSIPFNGAGVAYLLIHVHQHSVELHEPALGHVEPLRELGEKSVPARPGAYCR